MKLFASIPAADLGYSASLRKSSFRAVKVGVQGSEALREVCRDFRHVFVRNPQALRTHILRLVGAKTIP